jgi:hypothetical protein
MLKRFIRKYVSPGVDLIPMVMDIISAMEPDMADPEIEYEKARVANFTALPERENFIERFRGTRGLEIDTMAYD